MVQVSVCHPYRGLKKYENTGDYVTRLAQELNDEIQRLRPKTVYAFVAEPVLGTYLRHFSPLPSDLTLSERQNSEEFTIRRDDDLIQQRIRDPKSLNAPGPPIENSVTLNMKRIESWKVWMGSKCAINDRSSI